MDGACFFLVLSVSASATVVLSQRPPSFRAAVEMVSLSVTVTDPSGRYVGDLSASDFTVLEDGRLQDVVFFAHAGTSLAVSLLIDGSASMKQHLPLAQKAASEFVAGLRPGDTAQIIEFDSRVRVVQSFTGDRGALEQAIWGVQAGGSTSLYNAVYIAIRQLEALHLPDGEQLRRKVVVVLSDGRDTSSLIGFDELLDVVKRSHSVIFPIGLGLNAPGPLMARAEQEFELRRLAQDTGGRLLAAKDAASLSNVYNQIADELTSQYVLGYLSSNAQRPNGWRSIAVRLGRPNLQARTRPGYYLAPHNDLADR